MRGQRILSGGQDNFVCVHLLDGPLKTSIALHGGWVHALVALADNQHALAGSGGHVELFNVNHGTVLRTFTHHTDMVTSLALLPDGLRFVSGSDDGTTRVAHHGLAP